MSDDTTTTGRTPPPDPATCDTMIDPYGYEVPCDVVDPCSGDGVTTLYTITWCGPENPPLAVWCLAYPGHRVCSGVESTVETGPPPTLPPGLPATGDFAGAGVGVALGLMLAGVAAVIAAWLRDPR